MPHYYNGVEPLLTVDAFTGHYPPENIPEIIMTVRGDGTGGRAKKIAGAWALHFRRNVPWHGAAMHPPAKQY